MKIENRAIRLIDASVYIKNTILELQNISYECTKKMCVIGVYY